MPGPRDWTRLPKWSTCWDERSPAGSGGQKVTWRGLAVPRTEFKTLIKAAKPMQGESQELRQEAQTGPWAGRD